MIFLGGDLLIWVDDESMILATCYNAALGIYSIQIVYYLVLFIV